jgi:hypothetical protein
VNKEIPIACETCLDQAIVKYEGDQGFHSCPDCLMGKALQCEDCELTLSFENPFGYCALCGELYSVSEEVAEFLQFIDSSWVAKE